jgi:hypothetical protein
MTPVVNIPVADWNQQCSPAVQERALDALEAGSVLFFPRLKFSLEQREWPFLSPTIEGKNKNISFDISTGRLRGASVAEAELNR